MIINKWPWLRVAYTSSLFNLKTNKKLKDMSSQGIHENWPPGKLRLTTSFPKFYFCYYFLQNSLFLSHLNPFNPHHSQQNPDSVCENHTTYHTSPLNTVHEKHVEKLQPVVCFVHTNHKHLLLVGGADSYSSSSLLPLNILFKYLRITEAIALKTFTKSFNIKNCVINYCVICITNLMALGKNSFVTN